MGKAAQNRRWRRPSPTAQLPRAPSRKLTQRWIRSNQRRAGHVELEKLFPASFGRNGRAAEGLGAGGGREHGPYSTRLRKARARLAFLDAPVPARSASSTAGRGEACSSVLSPPRRLPRSRLPARSHPTLPAPQIRAPTRAVVARHRELHAEDTACSFGAAEPRSLLPRTESRIVGADPRAPRKIASSTKFRKFLDSVHRRLHVKGISHRRRRIVLRVPCTRAPSILPCGSGSALRRASLLAYVRRYLRMQRQASFLCGVPTFASSLAFYPAYTDARGHQA